jgi:hypothetical protein
MTIVTFNLPRPPVTKCWPLMSDEELDALAVGIKANGLQVRLVVNHIET